MKMLINGQWTDSRSGETIAICNPYNGEKLDEVPRGNAEDIELAVQIAKEGHKLNRRLPAHERHLYLRRAGELILESLATLRSSMIQENGKSHDWADFEIRKTAEIFMTVAERVKDPQGHSYPMDSMFGCETQMAMTYRQSLGVIGGIIPFNFPAEMLAYKLAGALAGGNSIVLKLPEDCPLTCLRIGELLLQAGIPASVFHLVTGYGEEAGEALVSHPDVPMISFTGSSETGKRIMTQAGSRLKRLSLELGGNDPVIVFADADLEAVANHLVKGRMTVGNGQACVADKRFIVEAAAVDRFAELAAAVVSRLVVGDPSDPAVDVGPLIHPQAAERVHKQIEDALSKGAKLLTGGRRVGPAGIEPTILLDATEEMEVMREECFGPVVPIIAFHSEEEAVAIANNTRYGLQGAVYTRDIHRAMRVADELEVGGVVINGSSCFRPGNVPYMPRKESGLGTDNMFNCVEEMTTGKALIFNGVTFR
jgi:glyceraldehyde-3-phosphate dehydrogenase (NADP+)